VSGLGLLLHNLKKNPPSIMGISLVFAFLVIAIFAPLIAPTPEGQFNPYMIPRSGFSPTPQSPSDNHIFGTTQGQYDIFYGVIWGTRTAFQIGLTVIGLVLLIGITLGSIAGYFGGKIDDIVMRITDIFLAFPSLILAMAITIAVGPGITTIILALVIVSWPSYARLVRGDILSIKEEDFIKASRGIGSSHLRIILRHILPNSIYTVLIIASLDIGAVVLSASALSFLGLGVPEGYADWGQMISFSRNWIVGTASNPFAYWYTVAIPGIFIFLFVLGWNLLGDAFRDIFDPRLTRS
jgi:peptide/nickel transport system permease protein